MTATETSQDLETSQMLAVTLQTSTGARTTMLCPKTRRKQLLRALTRPKLPCSARYAEDASKGCELRSFPRLSRMAIDVLSDPAMSAEAERVFSRARRRINWTRYELHVDVIEATEYVRLWQMQGLVDEGMDIEHWVPQPATTTPIIPQ